MSIVEVRETAGTAAVIFDLHPTPTRSAETLASQLAALLPRPHSRLDGGDITQYVDRTALGGGLVELSASGSVQPINSMATEEDREQEPAPTPVLSYVALLALLLGLGVVLAAYVKGVSWSDAERAYNHFILSQEQWRMGGGSRHVKLPTEEVEEAPMVGFTNTEEEPIEPEMVLDPSTLSPPGLPQLRPADGTPDAEDGLRPPAGADGSVLSPRASIRTLAACDGADEREEEVVVDDDDALQRARRLIDALGATGGASDNREPAAASEQCGSGGDGGAAGAQSVPEPAPVTLPFPPEPRGVPPSHTGYVQECIMDLVQPVDAEEVQDDDGTTLLRL